MTDKEKIIAEIERRRAKYKELISKSFGVEQEYFKGMAVVADEMMLFINSLPAEQPSGDFKEEFNNFCVHGDIRNPNFEGPFGYDDIRKTAIHFADWQKEQMMKSAIDAVIVNDEMSGCVVDCEQGCLVLEPTTYPIGQKLKILIIKEGE